MALRDLQNVTFSPQREYIHKERIHEKEGYPLTGITESIHRAGDGINRRMLFTTQRDRFPRLVEGCPLHGCGHGRLGEHAGIGANWVQVAPACYQEQKHSSRIWRDRDRSVRDGCLTATIDRAHALGTKVMLKPEVNAWTKRGVANSNRETQLYSLRDKCFVSRSPLDISGRTGHYIAFVLRCRSTNAGFQP